MVAVPVLCSDGEAPEWFMFEFQGEIECRDMPAAGQAIGIGDLFFSETKKDVVELTIGYHQLEGKIVTLKKPVAMLEKRQPDDMVTADDDQLSLKYEVVGVIRKKCIFKSRPRALISKPSTAS